MENIINKVIVLDNNENYIILKQLVYKKEVYYMASKLDDKELPTADFILLKQTEDNGATYVEEVNDQNVIQVLLEHIDFK